MKVLGITCEYNPMHDGHIYHLEESRAVSKADFVVCVMSGNFVQRGEPAVFDKWTRAAEAVRPDSEGRSRADLVIELPTVYATASAELFARGALAVMKGLGCVTDISFGSESGKIEELLQAALILYQEPEAYRTALRRGLDQGMPFPAAREEALAECAGTETAKLLQEPNNILGIEYIKALLSMQEFDVDLHTVEREGDISSRQIREEMRKSAESKETSDRSEEEEKGVAVFPAAFWILIREKILTMRAEELAQIEGVIEGMENRLKEAVRKCETLEEFLQQVKSKRFTRTAVNRMLIHILLGYKKDLAAAAAAAAGKKTDESAAQANLYARVLAANANGRKLLRTIRDKELNTIPVLTNINKQRQDAGLAEGTAAAALLETDILASDLYNLAAKRDLYDCSDQVMQPFMA